MSNRPGRQHDDIARPDHPTEDDLSAYLNGDIVEPRRLAQLQAHIESCAVCQEALAELKAVVWLLRRSENPIPSRSFRLDPSMVSGRAVRVDPWIIRVQPTLRRLTAIAAVLLLFVIVADVLAHQSPSGESPSTTREMTAAMGASTAVSSSGAAAMSAAASTSTAAASSAESAVSGGVSAGSAASDAKVAPTETALTAEAAPAAAQSQPQAGPLPPATSAPSPRVTDWRLAEFAVGVVVIWLLFVTVALPRLWHPREP